MTVAEPPRYLDAGETALVVEFGTTIDEAVNDRVLELDAALGSRQTAGVIELVPTYRSLMIHYDPLRLSRAALVSVVDEALKDTRTAKSAKRLWTIPACYDPEFADDLGHVATTVGLTPEAVVTAHASARYRVYMYGFAPGFAYLGGLPPVLKLPRRTSPRDRLPVGSLTIAAGQALISTVAMPSGWHILGRTPELLFVPGREPAFLVAVGDVITFERIDRARFDALSLSAAQGELVSRVEALP